MGELTAAADVSGTDGPLLHRRGAPSTTRGIRAGEFLQPGTSDRLRLIQRFKEAYLPLKEIRRRLSGLSDEEVRSLLVADDTGSAGHAVYGRDAVRRVASRSPGLPCLAGVSRGVPNGADGLQFPAAAALEASWLNQISGRSQRGAEGHGLREPPKVEHRLSGTSP